MGYTGVAGVAWVVLTDGNEYRIYNTHASVPVEKKLIPYDPLTDEEDTGVVQSLDLISRAGLRENRLEAHWQEQFVDRQVQEALKGLFGSEPDTSDWSTCCSGGRTTSLAGMSLQACAGFGRSSYFR